VWHHLIFANQIIDNPSDSLIIIPLSNCRFLRCFNLNIYILPFANQLKELFKCGHPLAIAHVKIQHLFICQIENVCDLLQRLRKMMI